MKSSTELQTLEQMGAAFHRSPQIIRRVVRQHGLKHKATDQPSGTGRPCLLYDPDEIEPLLPALEVKSPVKQSIEEEKLRKLKLENDRRERVLIPRVEVTRVLSSIESATKRDLKRLLVDEYPAEVAGLTVDGARVYGQRTFDRICEMFQKEQQHQWHH